MGYYLNAIALKATIPNMRPDHETSVYIMTERELSFLKKKREERMKVRVDRFVRMSIRNWYRIVELMDECLNRFYILGLKTKWLLVVTKRAA